MKARVTKKNFKRVAQIAVKELKERLLCYSGSFGQKYGYDVKKELLDGFIIFKVIPTSTRNPYITSAAISSINDFYQSSKWKESMFYGAEIFVKYDKKAGKDIVSPCISVIISIEKDEQQ